MSVTRVLKRLFGIKSDDLPYPCEECGRNVPPFQGVRDGTDAWCSEACANLGWERSLI